MRTETEARQVRWIVAVMLERETCLTCLSAKVGVTARDAARLLEAIARIMRFNAQARGRCRMCDARVGPIYRMERPEDPAP